MEISKEAISLIRGLNELRVYCFFLDKAGDSEFFEVCKVDFFDLDSQMYVTKTRAVVALQSLVSKGILQRIKKGHYKIILR